MEFLYFSTLMADLEDHLVREVAGQAVGGHGGPVGVVQVCGARQQEVDKLRPGHLAPPTFS